jgi:DNA-binding transcriptional MerR regulator
MEDFSEAEFRRPFSIESDDEAQFARLALHYRRVSEVLRFLARRSERPGRKGRPLDIDRMKMIKFARSKGLSLRQLARQIVAAGFHANRTPRPTREVLDMTVSTDDDGRVQSAKGKAVPNPAFCDEDGKPIPEGEFQRLLDDWKEEQAAVWEDRLRSAEAGQRGRQRRGQESAG